MVPRGGSDVLGDDCEFALMIQKCSISQFGQWCKPGSAHCESAFHGKSRRNLNLVYNSALRGIRLK
eukprot:4588116-Alexandrium_andersonii.AAC.1